ncbi:MAG: hypothetical protein ACRDXB_06315, partial [Actinomycetes bacterium]
VKQAFARADTQLKKIIDRMSSTRKDRRDSRRKLALGHRIYARSGGLDTSFEHRRVGTVAAALAVEAYQLDLYLPDQEWVELSARLIHWATGTTRYGARSEQLGYPTVDIGSAIRAEATAAFAELLPEPLRDALGLSHKSLGQVLARLDRPRDRLVDLLVAKPATEPALAESMRRYLGSPGFRASAEDRRAFQDDITRRTPNQVDHLERLLHEHPELSKLSHELVAVHSLLFNWWFEVREALLRPTAWLPEEGKRRGEHHDADLAMAISGLNQLPRHVGFVHVPLTDTADSFPGHRRYQTDGLVTEPTFLRGYGHWEYEYLRLTIYSRTGRVVTPLFQAAGTANPDMLRVVFTPGSRFIVLHRGHDRVPTAWAIDVTSPEPFSAHDRAAIRTELARHGRKLSDDELVHLLGQARGETGRHGWLGLLPGLPLPVFADGGG